MPERKQGENSVMFTVVTGDEATRVEKEDPEKIKLEIAEHLHKVYPHLSVA